ncbi:hypothetical protein ACE4Z7_24320, partial [Salmonella enterica]|uniref:hypothetical protein n=2 Tax=Bacteria TaxID=2 RepID=UPI003D2C5A11
HAVVAGQSKLTNEGDIRKSTGNTLALAEKNGVQTLAIMPFDCGTYDIASTAVAQLSTIKSFLEVNDIQALKNIVIVMEDEESYGTFLHYYDRIFKS